MFQRILFPSDGSQAACHAAAVTATKLADQQGAYVVCIVAISPTDPEETDLDEAIVGAQNDHARQQAARLAEEAAETFRRAGVACESKVLEGRPISAVIAREAQTGVYDAVAMGSRGMGGQKGDLDYFGSVTEHVIRRVSVPVIVIPPPKP